jgi:integrase
MSGNVHKRGTTWSAMWDEPRGPDGRRQQRKKGGFKTKKEAQAYLTQMLASLATRSYVQPDKMTVAQYLTEQWLPSLQVRESTHRAYASHVNVYFIPRIGHIPLQRLSKVDVRKLFADLVSSGGDRKILSASTIRRIHATLRVALNAALADDLIVRNPLLGLKLAVPRKPELQVWNAEQIRFFLDGIKDEPLHALYFFMATTGVRRGEAAGLRWCDVDLDGGCTAIRRQILQNGKILMDGQPKTRSGSRSISLDDHTVAVLRRHRAQQASERLAWGPAYQDTDLVFAREDGLPLRPEYIGTRFNRLQKRVGMKHIRLHDLRHSHATLMLTQGIPAKVVSERLGHASISITLDTYSHVLPGMGEAAAQQSADAVFGQFGGA